MNQVKAGAVLNYVIIGLNTLTGLLYTPYMLRCLGQNEYGLYSLVASVIAYLTLLDFGFGSAIVRYTAKIRATGTKKDEWELYGMFVSGYAIIGIIVTIAGLLLYFNVDRMFDRTMTPEELSQARIMMALMVANLAITFPFSVFGSIISAYEKFVFQRILSIARILLSTGVLIAVLALGYKAIALVIVQTIFSIGTLIANFIYCRYRLHIKIWFRRYNMVLFKEIMAFSWWNFLGAIVDRIYWGTGQFVLGAISGTVAVAIFSVAITLMNMYMTMSTSITTVLLPRITVMATKKENDNEISDLFIRTGRLQFCIMALILSGFIIFGKSFIQLWAGDNYIESYYITAMFFAVLLCPLIQNVGITILLARGQQKFRSLSYLAIAVISLAAQMLLSPKYGVMGCAWAVTGALFLGQWVVMNIYYKTSQHIAIGAFWGQIIRMSVAPALITFGGIIAQSYIHISSWLQLGIGILLYLCIYLPAFWYFSMNKYEKSQISGPLNKLGIALR